MSLAFWVLLLFSGSGDASSDFVVIVSEESALKHLARWQLRQIYLKKRDRIGRLMITPLHLPEGTPLRRTFDTYLFGGNFPTREYWLKQRLQAREAPPIVVKNQAYVLSYVERNPGFLGYIGKETIGELKNFRVRVVRID